MQNLADAITNFTLTNSEIMISPFLLVGFVLCGFGVMLTKRSREWAKEHLLWLIVGAVLIFGAAVWRDMITNAAQF